MRKNILWFIVVAFLISCAENTKVLVSETFDIDINGSNSNVLYLDNIATVERIQLKRPSSETYIGAVKKIIFHNDNLYISDSKNIFTYGMSGECELVFNKIGKAISWHNRF